VKARANPSVEGRPEAPIPTHTNRGRRKKAGMCIYLIHIHIWIEMLLPKCSFPYVCGCPLLTFGRGFIFWAR
jgi:hypothetical protein